MEWMCIWISWNSQFGISNSLSLAQGRIQRKNNANYIVSTVSFDWRLLSDFFFVLDCGVFRLDRRVIKRSTVSRNTSKVSKTLQLLYVQWILMATVPHIVWFATCRWHGTLNVTISTWKICGTYRWLVLWGIRAAAAARLHEMIIISSRWHAAVNANRVACEWCVCVWLYVRK